jgi:peptidoglycan/LPS O-acetylase OafA/YrhL
VQFSCVVPLFFLALRAMPARGRAAVAAVASASAGAYLLHWALMATRAHWLVWPISALTTQDGVVLSHSTLAHLPQFLLGVAGGYALWQLRSQPGSRRLDVVCEVLFWVSAAGAFLVASVPALGALELPYGRYLYPWMAGFSAAAVVTAPFAPFARRLLETAPLRALGAISYGVYVYQIVCMVALRRLMTGASFESATGKLQFAVLGFGLTVVVATASYLLIERPLLRWSEPEPEA